MIAIVAISIVLFIYLGGMVRRSVGEDRDLLAVVGFLITLVPFLLNTLIYTPFKELWRLRYKKIIGRRLVRDCEDELGRDFRDKEDIERAIDRIYKAYDKFREF